MNNFYNLTTTEISSAIIILNIVFSLILQLIIVWVYKKTHKGLSYSPSFIFTLVIVGMLGTIVMMVVQNNLIGAFALLGAFSLIRFRTILKETRDIAFVFFALVMGVAVGTNNYSIALIGAISVVLVILVFHKYNFASITNGLGFILTFNTKDNFEIESIKFLLKENTQSFEFLQARSYGVGVCTYIFSLKPKKESDPVSIIALLNKKEGISDIELITGEHSVEY